METSVKITENGISNENCAFYYDVKSKVLAGVDKTYHAGRKECCNGLGVSVAKAVKALKKQFTEKTTMADAMHIASKYKTTLDLSYSTYC